MKDMAKLARNYGWSAGLFALGAVFYLTATLLPLPWPPLVNVVSAAGLLLCAQIQWQTARQIARLVADDGPVRLTKPEILRILSVLSEKYGMSYAKEKSVGALQAKLSIMLEIEK